MCLARVMVAGQRESDAAALAEVAHIEPTEEGLVVTDLLGNRQTIEGTIESIDFMESIVLVRRKKE